MATYEQGQYKPMSQAKMGAAPAAQPTIGQVAQPSRNRYGKPAGYREQSGPPRMGGMGAGESRKQSSGGAQQEMRAMALKNRVSKMGC